MAAAKVAQISGDVRRALQLCRRAAEIATVRADTATATAAALSSSTTSSVSSGAGTMSVTIADINAAAKALSGGLYLQALAFTSPWQRLLLVSLAAYLKANVCEDAPMDAVYDRMVGMGRIAAPGPLPSRDGSAASSSSASSSAAAATRSGATTNVDANTAADAAAIILGYRNPPSVDVALSVCMQLHSLHLIVMESTPGCTWPRVRLNVQFDDLVFSLREDPLVKRFLVE